jgi:proline iminopeptidase
MKKNIYLLLTIMFMAVLNSKSAQNQAQSDNVVHPPAFTHASGKSIEVNGKQIWVEQEGNGHPLILLPGGPAASHLTFHPYFTSLSDKYRVIYYDYYGRGKSGRPASYKEITFEQDVEDLEGLRKELKLEKINIYGFSYGGMVAQAYALKYPAHVNKLILANTLHSAEMWQRNHENINLEVSRQFPEIWEAIIAMKKIGINSFDPIMQEKFAVASQLVRFYNPDNANKVLKESGSFNMDLYKQFAGSDIDFFIGNEVAKLPDFRPRLKDLKMPVMIIAGRYDRALYPAYQLEFKTFCPQAEFHMMERSGNFAHIEEPEKLFHLIRNFLDRP